MSRKHRMEGNRSVDGGAAPSHGDPHDSVEQYRDFIVDGEIYQALDLGRRLLQVDGDHAQRADTARLLLDRLRSNRDDSSDHANALLRVLANYATPSKELTEELLSLLFFCEHRVQIIHHISKLTYQSRECVRQVVNAYIELLSSDRSLLVPILGSLADLPLVTSDKALVVDATESLLDAASEDDVPAVVQSLLNMLVPAAAPRIVKKIRSQCNRLVTTATLSLTFDVIMRHAVAGSSVLTAILRVIRHSDPLTPFDLIFLALLLARPSENGAAVRVVTSLSTRGVLNRPVVGETLQRVRDQKWHEALPCFVRLASALLTACFNVFRSSSISTTVQCAVDMLGCLVVYRSAAQEEALSLMMSMVSQPQRLVLSTSRKQYMATAQTLCWDVAHAVASQLAHIAVTHPTSLAPFAHIFLDHLYGIAASTGQSFSHGGPERHSSSYPTSTLETLCRTMVLLTKHEPGMVSLLMITIQKQLVVPVGGTISGITTGTHNQASSVVQVKQLMAIFLAGEMLVHAVGEKADRASLLSWLQKLLSSATVSDETTAHVVRLLGSSSIANTLPTVDRSTSSSLLSAVFSRHGFEVKKHSVIAARSQKSNSAQLGGVEFLAGLSEQSAGWIAGSLVFDVVTYVRASRLGEPPIGWHSLDDHTQSRSAARSIERSTRAKTDLLSVLTEAFVSTASDPSTDSDAHAERVLVCSFALPSVTEDTFRDQALPATLWCYTCALQLAVVTTNALAEMQHAKIVDFKPSAKSMSETVRQRKRLLYRVQVCWTLHKRLRALLDEASIRMKQPSTEENRRTQQQCSLAAWLKLQIEVIEKQLDSKSTWVPAFSTISSLCSLGERLSLQAVSAVFEGLWKQQSSMIESGLEIELFRAFPARLLVQDTGGDDSAAGFASLQALVNTQDGKRTLKYLAQRLLDYSEMLDSLGDGENDSSEDQESAIQSTRHWVLEGIRTLCSALRSVIELCRKKQLQRVPSVRSEDDDFWEETSMELFAKGASDVRVRRGGDRRTDATGWATDCAIIYGSLVNAMVQSTLGDVACELIDVLLALSAHTRMTSDLSRISLALLHSPFPAIQGAGSAPKFIQKLPVLDPTAQTALASLLRPMPQKFHHLVYFIVGAWAIPSSLRVGLTHVSYIVECVEALVLSSSSKASKTSIKQDNQAEKKRKRADKDPDSEEGIDGWIARDGEHRVLKNLTHDTLPIFLETILACLTTAPLRAIPLPTAEFPRADANPFTNLIGTLAVVSKCLQVFVSAEMTGFNLPQRTSLSVLRCGPSILKTIEQALQACVLWREEGSSDKLSPQVGDLAYLQCLLEAAEGVVGAVEKVAASFQERIVLTMQQNTQTPVLSAKGPEDEGKRGKSAGRWGSDLLRKTYRNQFQRRKPLSRSEAKLLPYFTHSAEQLKSHIADTSGTYRFDHDHHRVGDALSRSLQAIRMEDDQLEGVLSLLTPRDGPLDMSSLDDGDDLVAKWSRVISEDEDDQSVNDEEESEEVYDEDQGSQEEDAGPAEIRVERIRLQNGSVASTRGTNTSVHTLVPQKKRAKKRMQLAQR